jgi:hypothetical protein
MAMPASKQTRKGIFIMDERFRDCVFVTNTAIYAFLCKELTLNQCNRK